MERIQQAPLTLQAPPLPAQPQMQEGLHETFSRAVQRISDYRLVMGWLVIVFWTASALAIDWDAQWHATVGRDGFWTPPHWMFYSTVTVSGLICAVVVLTETFLYYQRNPAITDRTTTPVLFFFRGPVGFALAGFGMLVMLISAPFDDYWHRIYGIDLAIWTPFHTMLGIGMNIASLGMVYLFASEVNRRRLTARQNSGNLSWVAQLRLLFQPAMLGLVVAATLLLTRFLLVMDETFIGSAGPGNLTLDGLKLPAYSILVAGLPLVLVTLVLFTGRIGIATLTGLLFTLFRLGSAAFTSWGIQTLAIDRGQAVRGGGNAGKIELVIMAYPVFLGLAGLIIDVIFWLTKKQRENQPKRVWLVAVAASVLAGLVLFLLERPWENYNDYLQETAKSINSLGAALLRQRLFNPDYWQALPLAILVAGLAGLVAVAVATSLRYTDR